MGACVPEPGRWVQVLNTDATQFGGSGVSFGEATPETVPCNDLPYSICATLPPLAVVWLAHEPR
jgi:1,4-alpha-glucan branching enzyme